jgi:nitrogen fixation NifU-like protein
LFVDLLKGKTIAEAKQIKDKEIAEILELPAIKLHCSVLAEDSIKKAIEDWESKNENV